MIKVKTIKLVLFSISGVVLIYHLVNLMLFWPEIPERIAIHFTGEEPDIWGTKNFLLIIPFPALLVWWLIGLLTKHPEKLNYINLTEKNREKQYNMASSVMLLTQNLSFIILILANESLLRNALEMENSILNFLSIFF